MAIDINIPSQVKNYANLAAFPATGSLKTIFIAEDTNKTYRWTGSAYVEISASQATAWGAITGTLSSQTDLQTALNAKVTGNTAITGATKTKVTYDSKGLVTAGADATTADIADSTNKRYVTDANLTVIGNTSGTNTGDQTLAGLGGVPTTRTLTINGTTQDLSADRTFTISTGITIGTTAITSGTVGRVLFEGTGNVVQESAGLTYNDTTKAFTLSGNQNSGISYTTENTSTGVSASAGFAVKNNLGVIGGLTAFSSLHGVVLLRSNVVLASGPTASNVILATAFDVASGGTGSIQLATGGYSGNPTKMTVFGSTGNVLIQNGGTHTDAGYKLDVNGASRFQSTMIVNGNATINGTFTSTGATGVSAIFTGGNAIVRDGNKLLVGGVSGNQTPDVSAVSEIRSTTQGFLCPRMTTTQKNAIATPATGLMVYDTTLNLISVYNGTIWISL